MGNVAQLLPYRDADNRLMFRGQIGVESKVSKFFPVRTGGRLMLRGKNAEGKIVWGFPYRDASGRLMGRTVAGAITYTDCLACADTMPNTFSINVSGFSGTVPVYESPGTYDLANINGTHTLTRVPGTCNWYEGFSPPMYFITAYNVTVFNNQLILNLDLVGNRTCGSSAVLPLVSYRWTNATACWPVSANSFSLLRICSPGVAGTWSFV
jgi:hypothetical protein